MYKEKTVLSIQVKEVETDNKIEFIIEVLENGYNFIKKTIYDDILAQNIINSLK